MSTYCLRKSSHSLRFPSGLRSQVINVTARVYPEETILLKRHAASCLSQASHDKALAPYSNEEKEWNVSDDETLHLIINFPTDQRVSIRMTNVCSNHRKFSKRHHYNNSNNNNKEAVHRRQNDRKNAPP